ncbi:MAG TPA: uroporphyrinogen decarboxylase [Acetobacteraceae bacterium]|jgi:uroporphyrinogen decarboxylase|nr:uroporphyrinogen decarboxylase [Acetobacteraceae bacterium]
MTKTLLRALRGEAVWPPPVWLMRQAGRYLPEYRAVRASVPDFIALCTTPALAAEVTLQPIRRFGFDAAILFSDILILPWALGQGLEYRDGEGPVLPPIRDEATFRLLDPARLAEKTAPVMEAIRQVRAGLTREGFGATALIGFAGAPFTVACYMVEGAGSRDFAATRTLAWQNPSLFDRIIDLLTETTVTYLAAQVEAGAEVIMVFDTWAGVLAPSQFRRYVIEPARRIVAALREQFPDLPVIGFPRMAGLSVAAYAHETGVNAVGLDTATDLNQVLPLLPHSVAAQGNLDPLALVAGGAAMTQETAAILAAMRGRPGIFNLGHGIVPQTPPEHVTALLELVRAS